MTAHLERLRISLEALLKRPPAERPSRANPYREAAAGLRDLRDALMHAPYSERPAYSLDDED